LANQIQQSINRLAGGIPPPFKGNGKKKKKKKKISVLKPHSKQSGKEKAEAMANVKQIRFFDALYDILEKGSRLFPALPYVSHQKPRPVL
uniref:Uncharacterized protein n=1 Tax=Sus scrofa TaxID=9823 RepID=A0A8D0RBR8_PIG